MYNASFQNTVIKSLSNDVEENSVNITTNVDN